MKIIKGISIFIGMVLIMGSCFDPPEFPSVPEIEYEGIEFIAPDSLILRIHFRDGDGDLGLSNDDLNYISYPFNNQFFFQTNPDGTLDTLYTFGAASPTNQYHIIEIADPAKGKLVFPRTRKNPAFSFLPAYGCVDYEYVIAARNLLIDMDDQAALDPFVRRLDTLDGAGGTRYIHIQDTLYTKINPDHYNIEVDFLVKEGNEFVEFDWREEYCTQSFDGRFPVLSDNPGTALEGTLRYGMYSIGFAPIFSVKTLKLRIQVKDRALNRSNVIETPEFTLDKIRKG